MSKRESYHLAIKNVQANTCSIVSVFSGGGVVVLGISFFFVLFCFSIKSA